MLAKAVVVAQVVTHWTRGLGFDSCWEVGFFLFPSLSYQKCVLNKVPRGGATLLIVM